MRIKIINLWYRLHSSFWFLPAMMSCAAFFLAFAITTTDKLFNFRSEALPWLIYSGGPDGARTVLSVISGPMITVAGVVFSITIVVLSLASSQFGPRLIKNFMNVRANKIVMGTFVATFIYGILVLRTVDSGQHERFVPSLSITIAIVMALLSLGVLIYFIHSVSESIRAENIIARVRSDLGRAVDRIFPEKLFQGEEFHHTPVQPDYHIPKACAGRSVRSAAGAADISKPWTTKH